MDTGATGADHSAAEAAEARRGRQDSGPARPVRWLSGAVAARRGGGPARLARSGKADGAAGTAAGTECRVNRTTIAQVQTKKT